MMPTISFTWVTILDNHTCKKCVELSGYRWEIPINDRADLAKIESGSLRHPRHGEVWSLDRDESTAHGKRPFHCRCLLNIDIDASDLFEMLQEILAMKHQMGI